jgi:putative ABC transport system permease protein
MRALDRKLLRDLMRQRGQAITIALVVASGVSVYVSVLGVYEALETSRVTYYEESRFADVFVSLERAPLDVAAELARIPGVSRAVPRIVEPIVLHLEGIAEPVKGRLISLPARGDPPACVLSLRSGRDVEPGRSAEVVALDAFAQANNFRAGDRLEVVVNGRNRTLSIAGTVVSPELVYPIFGGEMLSDPKRAGVLWMDRDALAELFDMQGAFNDVVLDLRPGASIDAVIAEVDRTLAAYGSLGAYGRKDHPSDGLVLNELDQLSIQATFVPPIFLAVAMFLLYLVLSRMVESQREQIAALKALGYSGGRIALHVAELALLITIAGTLAGTLLGAWFGDGLVSVYSQYFRFPGLEYRMSARLILLAAAVCLVSAMLASIIPALRVARLPPAEGMRAPSPPVYRPSLIEKLRLLRWFSTSARMVARDLERRPLRSLASSFGVGFAVMVLIVGLFWNDSLAYLLDVHFGLAERQDVTVQLADAVPISAFSTLEHLPGVRVVEPSRAIPVRVSSAQRSRKTVLTGLMSGSELRRIFDRDGRTIELPREGVLLTSNLANLLRVAPGEEVELELLRDRRRLRVSIAGIADEMMGTAIYMELGALHQALDEELGANAGRVAIDPRQMKPFLAELRNVPRVHSALTRASVLERFQETSTDMVVIFMVVLTAFASCIAVGVIYNAARISLAERSRDLATLRVLGFTRGEISAVLLGELFVQIVVGLPLGILFGRIMAELLARAMSNPELFRLPAIISMKTYLLSLAIVAVAAVISALLVRRRLDQLDLLAVLKARD